jgi:broad specificity phosphatase PhoE
MIRKLVAVLALMLSAATMPAQSVPITVFVVRHAEKGPEATNPPLTPEGRQRATALARVLGDSKITAVFASEFKRAQETVDPLATAAGVTTIVIPAAALDSLVLRLRALPPGSHAVVASHSNLVHLIVERLSGVRIPLLADTDYDRLVVVTVGAPGQSDAVVLRYGER